MRKVGTEPSSPLDGADKITFCAPAVRCFEAASLSVKRPVHSKTTSTANCFHGNSAGSFSNCYMVEGDDSNSKEDEFWFSKDGAILIKFNTYDEKAAGPATNLFLDQSLELVSFTR